MARQVNARLQVWAKTLMDDTECLEEVRTRFQLRMLDKFRAANKDVREEINHIIDNEQLFFEELAAICDEIQGNINEPADDNPNN